MVPGIIAKDVGPEFSSEQIAKIGELAGGTRHCLGLLLLKYASWMDYL
jgi:hypothetical protein